MNLQNLQESIKKILQIKSAAFSPSGSIIEFTLTVQSENEMSTIKLDEDGSLKTKIFSKTI